MRTTQWKWMALGGLTCLVVVIVASKWRDNRAVASSEPTPSAPLPLQLVSPVQVPSPVGPPTPLPTPTPIPPADPAAPPMVPPTADTVPPLPGQPLPALSQPTLPQPVPTPLDPPASNTSTFVVPLGTAPAGTPTLPPAVSQPPAPMLPPANSLPPMMNPLPAPQPMPVAPTQVAPVPVAPTQVAPPLPEPLTPPGAGASGFQPTGFKESSNPPMPPTTPIPQPQNLQQGAVTVATPTPPATRPMPPTTAPTAPSEPGEPPLVGGSQGGPSQLYRVRHPGETPREIARKTLGTVERTNEILRMNPELRADKVFAVGDSIYLPADACIAFEDLETIRPLPAMRREAQAKPKVVLPLTGTFPCNLDDKRSITLPRSIREQLGHAPTLLVSPGPDQCLWVTNQAHLDRLAERLEKSSAREVDVRVFKRLYFAQTEKLPMSPEGRLTISEKLAHFAGLHQEVVLVGIDDHFELWDVSRWRQYTQDKSAAARSGADSD